MPLPEHIHTAARLFPCVSAYARRENRRTYKQFQDGIQFLCSSGTPLHLLSAPLTLLLVTYVGKTSLTVHTHTSLRPPAPLLKCPGLHLVSFQALGPDNTNHQNTPVRKPRLQPPGYALVNLSITLRASLPCCCPDTNTQPTQPKS